MPKNKRPTPRKSANSAENKQDAAIQTLCDLAIELVEQEDSESFFEVMEQKENDLTKLIRKQLNQKNDDVLYEAIDRAKYADIDAYQLLKERIEEASEVMLFKREEGSTVEVNAFVIPMFVRTSGGLDRGQCFQDQQAFELLTKSFQEAELESQDATVVLVNHAYHLDEIDGITYSHLSEMIRDAFASMTNKKVAATPAIARSLSGWPDSDFAAEDLAVEVRFLLGFTLKSTEDAFYAVPNDDVDAFFDARAERFQHWAEQNAPLMARCLGTDGREIDIHFLYQDLFHGGKERGIAEQFMLQMMSDLNQGLLQHGIAAEQTKAVIAPAEMRDEPVLRVNLYAEADGALVASFDKPINYVGDLEVEIDDAYDALMTMGVKSLSIAAEFDADGHPVDVQPYEI
ncbi:DUF2863 family protein [Paraherbaspirillum soli]|uniref:DUF2863 family protein n=1 Tax=Paraherbaspirillum soli TaxID=631222 RepID=A0ABW0MBV2_9BURK